MSDWAELPAWDDGARLRPVEVPRSYPRLTEGVLVLSASREKKNPLQSLKQRAQRCHSQGTGPCTLAIHKAFHSLGFERKSPQTGVSAFWECLSFENMNGWFPWARSRWDLEPRPEADPTVELCLRHPGQVYTPLQEAGRGSRGTAGLHRAEAAEPRVWAGLSHRTGRHWPRLPGASSCCAGSASTSLWHIIVRSDAVISALSHCFTAEGQSRAAPTPRPLCISSKALGASPLPRSPRRHTSRKRDIF